MSFFKGSSETQRLRLSRDRTRAIKQGYPWIYKDWLKEAPNASPGCRAFVRDRDGQSLAYGMYDPTSPIAVRICAVEEERLDDNLILGRLENALRLRKSIFDVQVTNGFRLLNGEGDGLPGLVCDIYEKTAVVKLDGAGPKGFWNLDEFANWLESRLGTTSVFERYKSEQQNRGEVVKGKHPTSPIEFIENGVSFRADVVMGQKTGFFFDQRDNRERIRRLSKNRRVLNLFSYTGGFSVYAGLGGATAVTSVDLAKPAVQAANENWLLNKLDKNKHQCLAADGFEFLDAAKRDGKTWDLIIVDPPSFAHAERHLDKAVQSYIRLFSSALAVLSSDSIIAFSSCSSHISPADFAEICQKAFSKARRRARVLGVYGQPEDHPFPAACTELQYLKFNLFAL